MPRKNDEQFNLQNKGIKSWKDSNALLRCMYDCKISVKVTIKIEKIKNRARESFDVCESEIKGSHYSSIQTNL